MWGKDDFHVCQGALCRGEWQVLLVLFSPYYQQISHLIIVSLQPCPTNNVYLAGSPNFNRLELAGPSHVAMNLMKRSLVVTMVKWWKLLMWSCDKYLSFSTRPTLSWGSWGRMVGRLYPTCQFSQGAICFFFTLWEYSNSLDPKKYRNSNSHFLIWKVV